MFGREVKLPVDIMHGDRQSSIGTPTCLIKYVEWVCITMQNAFQIIRENLRVNRRVLLDKNRDMT